MYRDIERPRRCANTPGPGQNLRRGSDTNVRTRSHPHSLYDIEARLTLSIEEVASLLGLVRTAAYEAARRGETPCRKLGRRVIVPVPALLDWLGVSTPAA